MADTNSTDAKNYFKPRTYDGLKFIAQIVLPAVATLIFMLGETWNYDYTTQIVGTITAVDTFLGVLLQLSSNKYYKTGSNFDGELKMVTDGETGKEKVVFDVESDPETVVKEFGKRSFEFRVNRNRSGSS
jgi:hypothetical protein